MGVWGLAAAWWALVGAARRAARRGGGEQGPETLVWMAVLSVFLGVAVEWANSRIGLWGWNGLPANEFARYLAQGALFAAYLPALDGLAGLLGGDARGWAVPRAAAWPAAGFGIVVAAGGVVGGERAMLPPPSAFGLVALGLWLAADGANALRGQAALFSSFRCAAAWSIAGAALFALDWALSGMLGAGRAGVLADAPALGEYAGLAFAGPAARGLYVLAADALDLPFAGRSPRGRALLG